MKQNGTLKTTLEQADLMDGLFHGDLEGLGGKGLPVRSEVRYGGQMDVVALTGDNVVRISDLGHQVTPMRSPSTRPALRRRDAVCGMSA